MKKAEITFMELPMRLKIGYMSGYAAAMLMLIVSSLVFVGCGSLNEAFVLEVKEHYGVIKVDYKEHLLDPNNPLFIDENGNPVPKEVREEALKIRLRTLSAMDELLARGVEEVEANDNAK